MGGFTVMRAALLSCGPSLDRYDPASSYDVVIGVNRAAARYRCRYWSAGDAITIARNVPVGSPILVTSEGQYFSVCHNCGQATAERWGGSEWVAWESLPVLLPPDQQMTFSACAALALARALAATRIDVYGADMIGATDWDGVVPDGGNRSLERWATERKHWDHMVNRLADIGIRVDRIC